jgi:hypothetical protein
MRCVGPVMTEGKVRLMRHDWPRYGLKKACLVRCVGPVLTEGKVRLMQHVGPVMAKGKHASCGASVQK